MKPSRTLLLALPILSSALWAQTVAPVTTVITTPAPTVSVVTTPSATGTTQPPGTTASVTPNPRPVPAGTTELPAAAGETSIALDVGFGIRYVPPSRVTVPNGERLRIIAPPMSGSDVTYIWTKNGRAIEGAANNVLVLDNVSSADAGTYACLFSTPTTTTALPASSQALILGVGPTDRLLNLSTRSLVGAGADQGLISGFVVAAGARTKKLILRAVGPSLSLFGVTNPLKKPVLKIYDGNGKPYENGYAYPAVVGGPTYESDLAESLAKTGAFPLPEGSADAVVMMPFVTGSYTAHVTSGDGTSGTVLLEIYEVP